MKKKTVVKFVTFTIISLVFIIWMLIILGLKFVSINHGTYFSKKYYHYTIYIEKLGIKYFKNVNPNEISHVKVVTSNVTNNLDYFLTFKDSINIVVITDGIDTSRKVYLDTYTSVFVNPTYKSAFIHSDTDNNNIIFDD